MPSAQGAARSCRSPPRPRSRASPSASSSRPASAAHMFVFYYAVLSEVSPPVALSPFAASAITGGNPYKTMMLTWKYALPCFLVPFMFTQPDGRRGRSEPDLEAATPARATARARGTRVRDSASVRHAVAVGLGLGALRTRARTRVPRGLRPGRSAPAAARLHPLRRDREPRAERAVRQQRGARRRFGAGERRRRGRAVPPGSPLRAH